MTPCIKWLEKGATHISSTPCVSSSRQQRIVGGHDSARGQTTYIASLMRRGGHFCAASILNERWFLTAGHCVCSALNKPVRPSQIKAILGLYKISEFNRNRIENGVSSLQSAYESSIKTIVSHPQYSCNLPYNDIALLEASKVIFFDQHVRPICLASKYDNSGQVEGKSAIVSGWGWNQENQRDGNKPDTLQRAVVDVFQNEECEIFYRDGKRPRSIADTQLCAGKRTGGVDSCWADSGGPLVSDTDVLIGIVSTGIGCARAGFPGIYTRVSEFTNWIGDVVH
ncbi:trypsin-1 isoform X2 [Wyeomyia smithii]|uniref:trypsin-1 isoform X2 n=1 Tax=Wyeomyia smithii TaxID=174621 RepID=UPI002467D29D|nr:trypsin-1 isoform X2 [Wyeomyia smithii]XP_055524359.1 trypsin-1 isoform X2 [Wyeomyia smithii]